MEDPYVKYTLPKEIWLMVFHQVGSQWLGECRLICRDWNLLVQEVMCGQKLKFTNVDKISKFIYYLENNPNMATCIKYMFLTDVGSLALEMKLLSLALTPKIRLLEGEMSEELFGHLLDIAQKSPKKFGELQSLPNFSRARPIGNSTTTPNYYNTLLYFKESLTRLNVTMRPFEVPGQSLCVIPRLNEFGNLTELNLDLCGMQHLGDQSREYIVLDNILSKCTENLKILGLVWDRRSTLMEKNDFKNWLMAQDVKQAPNVHTLKLGIVHTPLIVEYLLYKYQNVSELLIGNLTNFSERIWEEVKDINKIQIIGSIPGSGQVNSNLVSTEEFTNLLQNMKSTTNQLQILQLLDNNSSNDLFDITKCKSTGITQFNIQMYGYAQAIHKNIVSLVSPVSRLEIDYTDYPMEYMDEEFSIEHTEQLNIDRVERVERVERIGRAERFDNNEQPAMNEEFYELLQIFPFDKLNILADLTLFGNDKTNEDICEELSYSSMPNLKNLTLRTCFCFEEEHVISLPEADLESLSLFKTSETCFEVQKILLATKKTEPPQKNFYLLAPGSSPDYKKISEDDASNFQDNITKIYLAFNSLNSLKINLNDHAINVKFDEKFQIVEASVSLNA
ncbi:hypothetical protein [Parasitella parasitica]|uniref:F-box domain-containing protein n=1 Tax=Parasitella parasitica TaxID=35722 RepID=A0A0B7MXB7_9FUNG|nr:hypothetical protein [Parasitella parasitica]